VPKGCGKEKCPACQIDEKTLKQTTTPPQKTLNMPHD